MVRESQEIRIAYLEELLREVLRYRDEGKDISQELYRSIERELDFANKWKL
jgi:hypothetical protein